MGLPVADLARLSTLLDEAEEIEPLALQAWLAGLQGESARLAPALRDLLARRASKETDELFDRPPAFAPPAAGPAAGDAVGPYRLLSELGSGGMGAVWLAERADGSLKRRVALKLPHLSWAPGLAERFAREREILASLEHPHIARLYDAGLDAQGRPFMALEYVEGQPIDVYCRERAIPIPARLRLLLQVAEAVAFAHGRLVLHRDLKPANILVTAQGQVRLLDFGVAKLMQGDSTAETALTQASGRALTLDYASPEQIRGEAIGTASDVYSLGVVAFELLAGARPYRLKRGSAAELEEAITGQDVPLASAMAQDAAAAKALRGDLDAIVNKALKKQPGERYSTVDALAQDWRRHLEGQRVFARPDTIGYRLMRFVRRHRVPLAAGTVVLLAFGLSIGIGATAVVILALLLGLGAALWQARKARAQASVARTEARTAKAVQAFLEDIFRASSGDQADPTKARQRTAKELLDDGAVRIEKQLDDVPEAKLRMLAILSAMFTDLGQLDTAVAMEQRRVTTAERAFGSGDPRLAHALGDVGLLLTQLGRMDEAREALSRADGILDAVPVADDEVRLAVDIAWGDFCRINYDPGGLPYAERAVRLALGMPPGNYWINSLAVLGVMQRLAGRLDESAATFDRAIALASQVPGGAWSILAAVHDEAAETAQARGDAAAGERHLRGALAIDERVSGPGSGHAATGLSVLANFLASEGRLDEALTIFAQGRERLAALPVDPQSRGLHAAALRREALAWYDHGNLARAHTTLEQARSLVGDPDDNPASAALYAYERCDILLDQGRDGEAEAALQEAGRIVHEHSLHGPRWPVAELRGWVRLELARGRGAAARQLLAAAEPLQASPMPATVQLLRAEAAWMDGRFDEAAEISESVLAGVETPPRPLRWVLLRLRLQLILGRARLGQQRPDEALAILEQARETSDRVHDRSSSLEAAAIRVALGLARFALGNDAGGRKEFAAARAIHARHATVGEHFKRPLHELEQLLERC